MGSNYLIKFLEEKDVPTVTKKRHTYLTYYGLEQQDTYVLKEGVIKTSIILRDGREFNISYIKGPDIISLLKDEVSQYTSAPFNVRIESDTAVFYRIPRVLFWEYVNQDTNLQDYVNSYYRNKLSEAILRQQLMTMNGKNGAVWAFIYSLIPLFGRKLKDGIIIDFQVTNDDIAGFCGISTRNSVNRILRGLREENVITMVNQKILILDEDYLKQFIQA
ncbi:Crp/Fnr family transcriptional regulator [uncultured Holdemanella sp.]|uniref:Crp/Fnr family transcriptional regulator n=1 Tax=uncultured Holdemanella sp. TaxID=1763549 RepID=UPI00265AE968|nr:Crp/Fnr family transcriptional regulator [uncultured Holdemanella sp.]